MSADEEFKPWTCEDEFKFPPMDKKDTQNNEHWRAVADYFTNKEKVKCEVWKDEVQNLLVFSGLFSAVVSALLVESYKSLRPDSTELLLLQLVNQATNNSLPNTTQTLPPSPSLERVNTLWFLSLVLSLGTSLVGIVALQWIREHLRPASQDVNLHHLPALIHMQSEALDRYFIPQIFALLPVLLITGLVLFFIGMIDFLWTFSHRVAIPVIVFVSIIFVFLLFTTTHPGIQSYRLHRTSRGGTQTTALPCVPSPYKSPQSWAILHSIIFLQCRVQDAYFLLRRYFDNSVDRVFDNPYALFKGIYSHPHLSGWTNYALLWHRRRDVDTLLPERNFNYQLRPDLSPHYDTVQALTEARDSWFSMRDATKMRAVFQCFHDYSGLDYGPERLQKWGVIRLIQANLLAHPNMPLFPPSIFGTGQDTVDAAIDSARLAFVLQPVRENSYYGPRLAYYHRELIIRLTRRAVSTTECRANDMRDLTSTRNHRGFLSMRWPLLLVRATEIRGSSDVPDLEFNAQLLIQLVDIMKCLFDHASKYPTAIASDSHSSVFPALLLKHVHDLSLPFAELSRPVCQGLGVAEPDSSFSDLEALIPQHDSLLLAVSKQLSTYITSPLPSSAQASSQMRLEPSPPDLLLAAAYIHVMQFREGEPLMASESTGLGQLLRVLRIYCDQRGLAYEAEMRWVFGGRWDFVKSCWGLQEVEGGEDRAIFLDAQDSLGN